MAGWEPSDLRFEGDEPAERRTARGTAGEGVSERIVGLGYEGGYSGGEVEQGNGAERTSSKDVGKELICHFTIFGLGLAFKTVYLVHVWDTRQRPGALRSGCRLVCGRESQGRKDLPLVS